MGVWCVPIYIRLFFVLMLYISFQVPRSSRYLVLTETKGITETGKRHHSANVLHN